MTSTPESRSCRCGEPLDAGQPPAFCPRCGASTGAGSASPAAARFAVRYRLERWHILGMFIVLLPVVVPVPMTSFVMFLFGCLGVGSAFFVVGAWRVWASRKIMEATIQNLPEGPSRRVWVVDRAEYMPLLQSETAAPIMGLLAVAGVLIGAILVGLILLAAVLLLFSLVPK